MGQAGAAYESGEAAGPMSFGQRVLGVVRLEPHAWEEVVADAGAMGQAALVVAAAAVAAAFVAGSHEEGRWAVVLGSGLSVPVSWLAFSGLLWAVANWFRHPLGIGTTLRVVGFAMAPLVLLALAATPVDLVQGVVRLVAFALSLGALVAGTCQALRVETPRAALVCLTAGVALVFLVLLVLALLPPGI